MAGNCELTTQKIDEKFKERKLGVTEESSNKLERSESNKRDGQTSLLHSLKVLFNECMKPFLQTKSTVIIQIAFKVKLNNQKTPNII